MLGFLKKEDFFLGVFFFSIIFGVPLNAVKATDNTGSGGCNTNIDGKTDQELKDMLKSCEVEIQEHKNLLINKQKDSVTIERDVAILESKLEQSKLALKKRGINIYQIDKEIGKKLGEIKNLSTSIGKVKSTIGGVIRRANELDSFSFVEAILSSSSISDFFVDLDNFDVLERELKDNLSRAEQIKGVTEKVKMSLEEKQKQETALKIVEENDKKKTESYKSQKESLLKLSKAQENEYKKMIADKEKARDEIRDRVFKTVGGVELRFGDAVKLIWPYQEIIGVEPALVLAVLTQESAVDGVIGRNLGKCTYNQKAANKDGTVMSNSQKKSFLAIVGALGLSPDKTPVSCPIYSDGAFGGAMGPSQFMPNTWWNNDTEQGYKRRVSKVLGISEPSPFRNLDAFIGTALYLSDARERCATIFNNKTDIWACSAAKYYAGLSASGSRLSTHMVPNSSYGRKVANRAVQFQKDIDLLDL